MLELCRCPNIYGPDCMTSLVTASVYDLRWPQLPHVSWWLLICLFVFKAKHDQQVVNISFRVDMVPRALRLSIWNRYIKLIAYCNHVIVEFSRKSWIRSTQSKLNIYEFLKRFCKHSMLTQLTKGVLSKTGPFGQTKHWDEQTETVLCSAYFGIQTMCLCYIP